MLQKVSWFPWITFERGLKGNEFIVRRKLE